MDIGISISNFELKNIAKAISNEPENMLLRLISILRALSKCWYMHVQGNLYNPELSRYNMISVHK